MRKKTRLKCTATITILCSHIKTVMKTRQDKNFPGNSKIRRIWMTKVMTSEMKRETQLVMVRVRKMRNSTKTR